MARLAVFASGRGSNFIAIHNRLKESSHKLVLLASDKANCGAVNYAKENQIPFIIQSYKGLHREDAEKTFIAELEKNNIDLIALAGFMRLLSPGFVDLFPGKIINIHPSLLPKYPGTEAIEESYASDDAYVGISIHYVDHGLDTGPLIMQKQIDHNKALSLDEFETKIHELEHKTYPELINQLLTSIEETQ